MFSYTLHFLTCAFLLKRRNEEGDPMEDSNPDDAVYASELLPRESTGPVALSVRRAK